MYLTPRGTFVVRITVVIGFLAVLGFCGWIEGGMR